MQEFIIKKAKLLNMISSIICVTIIITVNMLLILLNRVIFNNIIDVIFYIIFWIFIFIISYGIHTIIHELGHLTFGLLNRYKFVSLQILFLIIIKKQKTIFRVTNMFKNYNQCVMLPYQDKYEKYRVILFNLGGCINNLLFSILGIIMLIEMEKSFFNVFYSTFILAGILMFFVNLFPSISKAGVFTDGFNAIILFKDKINRYCQANQVILYSQVINGIRPRDLSIDNIIIYSEEYFNNIYSYYILIMYYYKCLDMHDIKKAKLIIDKINENSFFENRIEAKIEKIYIKCIYDVLVNHDIEYMMNINLNSIDYYRVLHAILADIDKVKANEIEKAIARFNSDIQKGFIDFQKQLIFDIGIMKLNCVYREV